MIIAANDPFPALLAVGVELFLDGNLTASAGIWVFEALRAHSVANFFKSWRRRFHHFLFRIEWRLIGPLLHKFHPTRRPGRLPRQKASYFGRNRAAFTYSGGCELAYCRRSRALNLRKVRFDRLARLKETSLTIIQAARYREVFG